MDSHNDLDGVEDTRDCPEDEGGDEEGWGAGGAEVFSCWVSWNAFM